MYLARLFDYKLAIMPYLGNVWAAKLIVELGDIHRFPKTNKNYQPTSTMTVLADKYVNLVTATPGVIK